MPPAVQLHVVLSACYSLYLRAVHVGVGCAVNELFTARIFLLLVQCVSVLLSTFSDSHGTSFLRGAKKGGAWLWPHQDRLPILWSG